jgi:peptidoglycan/LPS O-acetylase OafA/YrhL
MIQSSERVIGLEGMRGIAAFWVFTHHFILIFYPTFYFGPHSWINHILNADLAVAWFFVHSGFVLSLKSASTTDKLLYFSRLTDQASRRYLRLMPPVLFSILMTYFLMKAGLIFNQDYAAIIKNEWLSRYLNFTPDFYEALRQSFWGTYFNFQSGTTLNPNLWTIGYELVASYYLFAILGFLPWWRPLFWLLLPVAFVIGPWKGLMGFVLGAFLTRTYQIRIPRPILWVLTILGFYLSDIEGPYRGEALGLSAGILMLVLLKSPKLREILEYRFFKRLGELSYSLYVLHFAVLASFTSYMGIRFGVHKSQWAIIALYFITTLVLWGISEIGERLVDRPGVTLSKIFSQKIFRLLSKFH